MRVWKDSYHASDTEGSRVVDAGGRGLLYFLEGFIDSLAQDKDIPLEEYKGKLAMPRLEKDEQAMVELDFQYCTELLIKGLALDEGDVKDHLAPLGDSMLVVGDENLLKVHIHSNHPGKVLETCLQFGSISDVKINNMLEEVHEQHHKWDEEQAKPQRKIGVVAVAAGEGIKKMLLSLGVDEVVEGGQTMNPSTEDLVRACDQVGADQIIILPNNANVIMTAEQAKHLSSKNLAIVPTRSVMQAINALIAFNEEGDLEQVAEAMIKETSGMSYGEVTYAVRDSKYNGFDIKEGDFIGLVNDEIAAQGNSAENVVLDLLNIMKAEEHDLLTIFYGSDTEEKDALQLKGRIMGQYADNEIEMHYGGQPHYNYLLSVE